MTRKPVSFNLALDTIRDDVASSSGQDSPVSGLASGSRYTYVRLASADSDEVPGVVGDNPFSNPEVAERYRLIYEKAQYECRHYFDPELSWTAKEEAHIRSRIDRRVCLWAVSISMISESYFLPCTYW